MTNSCSQREREKTQIKEELLSILRYELGEVTDWDELCPGVYSLTVEPNPDSPYSCGEFYLVLPDAPISQEARALGKPLDDSSGLLYPVDPPEEGGWTAVLYELCKSRFRHGTLPLEGWSLADAAMEGMDLCPAHFGPFPVPPLTPWGWTFRHRALDNGIYWIETSQCKTVLAVCQPIWSSELSEGVTQAGKKLAHDKGDGSDFDYLFFEGDTVCTAIFELLKVRPQWLETGLIRRPELMNALWEYAPVYATLYAENRKRYPEYKQAKAKMIELLTRRSDAGSQCPEFFEDCEKVHSAHRADPGAFAGVCRENRCSCPR